MLTFLIMIDDPVMHSKLESLYLTYHKEMHITAYHILKDLHLAEDIVQDAIIRVSKNLDKIDEVKCKKTRGYLVTIVRNLSINAYNKRKGIVMLDNEKVMYIEDTEVGLIEEDLLKKEFAKEMAIYLNELYSPYADILMLKYIYGLKSKEIASLIDIKVSNVDARLSRARVALKKILEREGVVYEQSI